MFRIVLLFTFLTLIIADCPDPSICFLIDCAPIESKCLGGTIIPNGGYCGCCPACVPDLKETKRKRTYISMIRILIYFALLALVGAGDCPDPSICLRIFCGVVDRQCLGGTIIPNAGFCGCCPACVPNLMYGACPPDICWRMFCAAPSSCPNGQIVPRAGYCGCCAVCVPDLKIGDHCGHTFLTGSVQGRCPKGSICDNASVTCKPSKASNMNI